MILPLIVKMFLRCFGNFLNLVGVAPPCNQPVA